MQTTNDYNIYRYNGFGNCESRCGLQILSHNDITIIVLHELRENPGTSITNCYEYIATEIYHNVLKEKTLKKIIWIEQYDEISYSDGNEYKENLSQVFLNWDKDRQQYHSPKWQICDQKLISLIRKIH